MRPEMGSAHWAQSAEPRAGVGVQWPRVFAAGAVAACRGAGRADVLEGVGSGRVGGAEVGAPPSMDMDGGVETEMDGVSTEMVGGWTDIVGALTDMDGTSWTEMLGMGGRFPIWIDGIEGEPEILMDGARGTVRLYSVLLSLVTLIDGIPWFVGPNAGSGLFVFTLELGRVLLSGIARVGACSNFSSTSFGFQFASKLTIGRPGLSETMVGVGSFGLRSLMLMLVALRMSSLRISLPSFILTSSCAPIRAVNDGFRGIDEFSVY